MRSAIAWIGIASLGMVACGGGDGDGTSGATTACESVGTAFCAKAYSCLSPTGIAALQLPPTEAECLTSQNADCSARAPAPGFCKGSAQVSESAANACAAELQQMSCS